MAMPKDTNTTTTTGRAPNTVTHKDSTATGRLEAAAHTTSKKRSRRVRSKGDHRQAKDLHWSSRDAHMKLYERRGVDGAAAITVGDGDGGGGSGAPTSTSPPPLLLSCHKAMFATSERNAADSVGKPLSVHSSLN